ncbi:MAG: transposase [Candidatus Omnitrophica bacterium]|nr:transposase [Candidatus Omnitrophota bacterium]MDD5552537.1 transposase [Candidatus Omnitrophota bacterium]
MARIVAVGLPHHITQRGNYQQDVFSNANDKNFYLAWIQEYSLKYNLSILVYCLMQNHIHFIAIPNVSDSLARTFNAAHMRYSQYFNSKSKQKGHLWQGRFYSCVLDEPHLILAGRYIERNPVRAGLVEKPWQWPWSSAMPHIDKNSRLPIELGNFLEIIGMSNDSWKKYIDFAEEESSLRHIRKCTLSGRPLGAAAFIETLESKFKRKLFELPKGRRPNNTKK